MKPPLAGRDAGREQWKDYRPSGYSTCNTMSRRNALGAPPSAGRRKTNTFEPGLIRSASRANFTRSLSVVPRSSNRPLQVTVTDAMLAAGWIHSSADSPKGSGRNLRIVRKGQGETCNGRPASMSSGFEIAVAAFKPEATAWSRLRTTLARRSNAATLLLERDWRMIRSFDPTGYPAPRPIAATPVSITPPLRVSRTARPAPPGFVSCRNPRSLLIFPGWARRKKGRADLGQARCGLVFSATACD